jgi:thiol-disulfide isomerase/thioredoxin
MVAAALVLAFSFDRDFEQAIATGLPDWVTNPTDGLERGDAVRERIADVRGGDEHTPIAAAGDSDGGTGSGGSRLPVLSRTTPDITAPGEFFNTDFWTYTCINCIRTIPHVEAWYRRYERDGLVVIGVHTPEFPFERDAGNVADAIADDGITYPVVQDNDYGTWNAFGNQYWPAKYLIDPSGRVRYAHFGEGDYGETESAIRSLLAESRPSLGARAPQARAQVASRGVQLTPETYLGAARASQGGWVNRNLAPPGGDFGAPPRTLPPNGFAYSGNWRIGEEDAVAGKGARIDAEVSARRVFLVLGSPGRERDLRVMLDGEPIAAGDAGADVHGGVVRVGSQRLYSLVDLPRAGHHRLTLRAQPGIAGYAFTFG